MTLSDLMATDFAETFANADEFGEVVRFQPAGGGEVRELAADVVAETIVGKLDGVDQLQDGLVVTVAKSATAGILRPKLGDTIWRPSDGFDPLAPYQWQGIVEYEDAATWTLRYVRLRPFRANASSS